MLTKNAAQDIKILNIYLQFSGECIKKVFAEIKSLVNKYISNSQKNSLEIKTKIKHNFHWLYVLIMSRTHFRVNPHSIFA